MAAAERPGENHQEDEEGGRGQRARDGEKTRLRGTKEAKQKKTPHSLRSFCQAWRWKAVGSQSRDSQEQKEAARGVSEQGRVTRRAVTTSSLGAALMSCWHKSVGCEKILSPYLVHNLAELRLRVRQQLSLARHH